MTDASIQPEKVPPLEPPKSEAQITRNWPNRFNQSPTVSILCIVYNHLPYIKASLNGFLAQDTDFPFEIVVRDDASNDGTQAILRRYAQQYPNIIKLHIESENQYSKGVPGLSAGIPLTTGKFIATCEGDDYWISPHKLQKQRDMLKAHPESDICLHKAIVFDCTTGNIGLSGRYGDGSGYVKASTMIRTYDWSPIPTASLLVTRSVAMQYASFRSENPKGPVGDVPYTISASARGGGVFLDEALSVYRIYSKGSFTEKQNSSAHNRLYRHESLIQTLIALKKSRTDFQHIAVDINFRVKWSLAQAADDPGIPHEEKLRLVDTYLHEISGDNEFGLPRMQDNSELFVD